MKTDFRVVPDTNIVLADRQGNEASPSKELFDRWRDNEFTILYSADVLEEYIEKLLECGASEEEIIDFIVPLKKKGENIVIQHFHLPATQYPSDKDDIAFILCADNGKATHLVTYDSDLLEVQPYHFFTICLPVPFLKELRSSIAED